MLSDNWEVYMTQIDGFSTVVRINMDARKAGFPERFPQCMILNLTVLEKAPNGFPSANELSRLQEIEQVVLEVMGEEGVMPVSLTSQEGIRELIIFTDQPSFLSTRISNRLESMGLTEEMFQLGSPTNSEEPWSWYEFVYPNERTLASIQTQKSIARRENLGDLINVPRQIDHYAYFQTKEDAQSFAQIAKSDGFTIVALTEAENPKKDRPYIVNIQQVNQPNYQVMGDVVYKLYDVIHFYQGFYAGWNASLKKSDTSTEE